MSGSQPQLAATRPMSHHRTSLKYLRQAADKQRKRDEAIAVRAFRTAAAPRVPTLR